MAALCQIPIGIRHYFSKMSALRPILNVINTSHYKAVSHHPSYPPIPILPNNPTTPHPHPYLTKHVNHVFMFLSYCITYKAISLPLVAAVASAAAVAAAEAGGGEAAAEAVVTAAAEVVVGAMT